MSRPSFFYYIYKCKGSVASLQIGFSNLFKSPLLRFWMLGLLLICASFDKFLVVLIAQNGNTKDSFLFFSVVNEIYDYYEAQSAIILFQINKLFSHQFWGFKLEIFDPRNVRNPINFHDLSNKYISIFITST